MSELPLDYRAQLDRDRWLAPLVLAASLAGGILVAVIGHLWR